MSDDDVLAQLEAELGDVVEPGPEHDLQSLSKLELVNRRSDLLAELRGINQRFGANSREGRNLQADLENINREIARRRS